MEVKMADSFFKSLKRMIDRERWYWKVHDFLRYDILRFLGNVWRFRRALLKHYWWDHHGTLMFMEIGLTHMADGIEKDGMEVDESRLKKVAAMRRAIELIKNYNEDRYIDMAEAELGKVIHHEWNFVPVEGKDDLFELEDQDTEEDKAHNRKVFDRARQIGEQEWAELWQILKGQEHGEFEALYHKLSNEEQRERDHYENWFNGTGMRGWWD